jgi:hypothetical protein
MLIEKIFKVHLKVSKCVEELTIGRIGGPYEMNVRTLNKLVAYLQDSSLKFFGSGCGSHALNMLLSDLISREPLKSLKDHVTVLVSHSNAERIIRESQNYGAETLIAQKFQSYALPVQSTLHPFNESTILDCEERVNNLKSKMINAKKKWEKEMKETTLQIKHKREELQNHLSSVRWANKIG